MRPAALVPRHPSDDHQEDCEGGDFDGDKDECTIISIVLQFVDILGLVALMALFGVVGLEIIHLVSFIIFSFPALSNSSQFLSRVLDPTVLYLCYDDSLESEIGRGGMS